MRKTTSPRSDAASIQRALFLSAVEARVAEFRTPTAETCRRATATVTALAEFAEDHSGASRPWTRRQWMTSVIRAARAKMPPLDDGSGWDCADDDAPVEAL